MRLPLVVATAVFIAGSLCAHADTVNPGTYGGTELASTGPTTIAGTDKTVSFTESVYADPSNPYCVDCLDFVIQVDNSGFEDAIDSVSVTDFSGYLLSYAYDDDGSVAPTDVSENRNGKVTFDFGNLVLNEDSDQLIIYTNASDYTTGGVTVGRETTDPPGFQPAAAVTPEPSSLMLLGTGLLGVAGVLRRRLA